LAVLVRRNFPFVEVPVPVGNTAVEGEVGAGEAAAAPAAGDNAAVAAARFSVLVASAALAGTTPVTRTVAVARVPMIRLTQKLIVVFLLNAVPQAPLLLKTYSPEERFSPHSYSANAQVIPGLPHASGTLATLS
jgi:hypothetical protein